jgi:hypothetical protein
MARGWPPLSQRELLGILGALKFTYTKSAGGHDFYVAEHSGRRWKVTVAQKINTFGPESIALRFASGSFVVQLLDVLGI